MALLDQVKKSLTSGFQVPQFGQSQSLKQLQAGTAGRQVIGGEGGPRQGSVAEIVAAAGARQQQKEDIAQGELAAAQLEQQEAKQEQQFEQRKAVLNEEELNVRQQMQNKTQEILMDFSQRRGELDFKENSSRVQFAMAAMRMSNDDYLDQLEVEGAQSRLNDQAAFDWELTQTIMADEMEIFKNDLSFKAAMNADDREFKEYLFEMDMNTAIELAALGAETAEVVSQYEAAGQIISGAASATGTYLKNKPAPTTNLTETAGDSLPNAGSSNLGNLRMADDNLEIPSAGGYAPPNDIVDSFAPPSSVINTRSSVSSNSLEY